MRRYLWVLVALCACGEPILRNAPKPDPGAVAGVAAAAAAAATLASPDAAAKRQEQRSKGDPDNRGVVVKETVPAAVFDRLDHRATTDAGVDGQSPAAPASAPPRSAPPASAPPASAPPASAPPASAPPASAPPKLPAPWLPRPQP